MAGSIGIPRRSRILGRCSRASWKAVSGARNSICPAYLRSRESTRDPSTARIRIFASKTSMSALLHAPFPPESLEILHEFVFGGPCCGNQLLHLFSSDAKRLQIGLAGLWRGRDVDADGRTMPRDGDWRLRFQITGQVLPKLPNSNLCSLHNPALLRTQ